MNRFYKEEISDSRYEAWTDYRNNLTEYVINCIESYYTSRILADRKLRKLKNIKSLESLIFEYYGKEYRPTLAIWGAGGLNDIDAKRLSNNFSLVLIDDNLEATKAACERFSLPEDTRCIDLEFWKIEAKSYDTLEALLEDKAPIDVVSNYIEEIIGKIPKAIDTTCFDFSLVAGVASQLNARLWKVIEKYEGYELLTTTLSEANIVSSRALHESVIDKTKHAMIWSYELRSEDYSEDTKLEEDEGKIYLEISEIEGNYQLCKLINSEIEKERIKIGMVKSFMWPFSKQKKYRMISLLEYKLVQSM